MMSEKIIWLMDMLKCKKKAYAINVRVALEEQRDKCYKLIQIEQDKQNVNEVQVGKILNLIDNINEYLNLFELIKEKKIGMQILRIKPKNGF